MTLSALKSDRPIILLSLILVALIFTIGLSIPSDASQPLTSSHLKLGKVLKLGSYNESYFYRFDAFPQLSYSEPNRVYVLWHNSEEYLNKFNQTDYNITSMILRTSTDNGNSFNPLLNVRNSTELYGGKFRNNSYGGLLNLAEDASDTDPILSSSNNQVYVAWVEFPANDIDDDVILKRSLNNGSSFEPIMYLSNESRVARGPAIAVGGNNSVFLIWNSYEENPDNSSVIALQFKRSSDAGKTFERNSSLRNYTLGDKPLIASSGNNIYLAGYDGNNAILIRSDDSGAHFKSPLLIPIKSPQFSNFRLTASGNTSYLVWDDAFNVYFVRIDDGSRLGNIMKITNLTNACNSATYPDISARNNELFLVWVGRSCDKFGSDIYGSYSADGGKTFGNSTNLTNNSFFKNNYSISSIESNSPRIITSNSSTFIVWENKFGHYGDIMFSRLN